MLTPYDEFPIHQAPRPFSHIPSTDHAWDDGYFFSAYSADQKVILFTGMRVSPNADVIGGYAGVNIEGRQYTARFSRIWRPDFDTAIGPLAYAFTRPMREIRLTLANNESDLTFDLVWTAISEAYLEQHHLAENRGRRTTDQTRYTQSGKVAGRITFRGRTWDLSETPWYGARDHSWGLYHGRAPLRPDAQWLPPVVPPAEKRAMRFWLPFQTEKFSGFYHFHQDSEGRQRDFNDVFGTGFEGRVDYGWSGTSLAFVSAKHSLEFFPDTRAPRRGVVDLVDENGQPWRHELEIASPPWLASTIGYGPGSWKDGGNISTWHGPGITYEWDEYDLSRQPFDHKDHAGNALPSNGMQSIVHLTSSGPDGVVKGQAYLEFFIDGAYRPYGFG